MIIHDAATTFVSLIDTALLWARLAGAALAFVACVIAFAVGPLVAPAVKTAARRVAGPSWRRGDLRARILARTRVRTSGGRTADQDYREAA